MKDTLQSLINVKKSIFVKNAAILTFGTIIAQILPFIFYPYFSRVFSPRDFGVYATISSLIPFFSIFASGTYENGILISKDKREAANLVIMILIRSFFILLFCWGLLHIFSRQMVYLLNEEKFEKWIFVIPLSSFATVIYNLFNEWCVTYRYFLKLSINKITNTSSVAIGKFLFGIGHFFSSGLILGDLIGRVITAFYCVVQIYKLETSSIFSFNRSDLRSVAVKYNHFPKLYFPDQFLNLIGGTLHVFIIGIFFSSTNLGYFSLAASILTVPVTVVSSAIKDVFRQKANECYIETGSCRTLYLKLLVPISILSILLSLPIYYLLPKAFSIFFGETWFRAGLYAQILMPMFVSNFISMSLSGVLLISKKYKVSLMWQTSTIILSIIAFIIGIRIYNSFEMMLYFFMAARTISYLLYIYLSYYFSVNNEV